jgi:hypothetical protein
MCSPSLTASNPRARVTDSALAACQLLERDARAWTIDEVDLSLYARLPSSGSPDVPPEEIYRIIHPQGKPSVL